MTRAASTSGHAYARAMSTLPVAASPYPAPIRGPRPARTASAAAPPAGRPAKLTASPPRRSRPADRGRRDPRQGAAGLGVSRSTLYRELHKHREGAVAEQVVREG